MSILNSSFARGLFSTAAALMISSDTVVAQSRPASAVPEKAKRITIEFDDVNAACKFKVYSVAPDNKASAGYVIKPRIINADELRRDELSRWSLAGRPQGTRRLSIELSPNDKIIYLKALFAPKGQACPSGTSEKGLWEGAASEVVDMEGHSFSIASLKKHVLHYK